MAIDLVDGRIEGKRKRRFLVFALLFAEGGKVRDAGVLILFEIQAQDLVQGVAGAEVFRIDRKHARVLGTQLGVQIDADGNAADLAHASSELGEAFVELPTVKIDKIRSAMRVLDACAGFELLRSVVISGDFPIESKIEAFVTEHLAEDLSVSLIAGKFHLTHTEIYSIFREYFNSTPAEYVRKRRLSKAYKMLDNTDMPVFEIAKRVGIVDYNYFSKLFKAEFGKSPRVVRAENGITR